MSLLYNFDGICKLSTTIPLSKMEAVPAWRAPAVERAPHSAGITPATSSSSVRQSSRTIERSEPCFVSKTSAYTHQQAHWINAIRGRQPKHEVEFNAVVSPCRLPVCRNLLLFFRNHFFALRVLSSLRLCSTMLLI